MAIILNVEVKEIYLYPLGGISKFNMPLNIKPKSEFLILIMGPIFQMLAYFLLIKMIPSKIDLIKVYNFSILGFNLLPIYPLDGGKLLKILLDNFFTYKNSFKLIIITSYIITFIIFLINKKNMINVIVLVTFLVFLVTREKNKINYYYQKFILERYLNNYNFKNSKIITNENDFYRNKRHLIRDNDKYYLEKEYLKKMYKKC